MDAVRSIEEMIEAYDLCRPGVSIRMECDPKTKETFGRRGGIRKAEAGQPNPLSMSRVYGQQN